MKDQDNYHQHLSACKFCQEQGQWGKNGVLDLCEQGRYLYAMYTGAMDAESYKHFRADGVLWAKAYANQQTTDNTEALDTLGEMLATMREQIESTAQLVLGCPLSDATGKDAERFRFSLAHLVQAQDLIRMTGRVGK